MRRFRKPVNQKWLREFESPPLRLKSPEKSGVLGVRLIPTPPLGVTGYPCKSTKHNPNRVPRCVGTLCRKGSAIAWLFACARHFGRAAQRFFVRAGGVFLPHCNYLSPPSVNVSADWISIPEWPDCPACDGTGLFCPRCDASSWACQNPNHTDVHCDACGGRGAR